jgi:2-polyprenyl-3-methyl-5-hydroxy-6-metoxy-1,4-benzoquinol methylase
MSWDVEAESSDYSGLEGPSELALTALEFLQKYKCNNTVTILDIGCGNGRDAFYFSDNLRCTVLGIDISEEAIELASHAASNAHKENVHFQQCSFTELKGGTYDVVLSSGVYHFLKMDERKAFRETVMRILKPNGFLFLSTLSVGDTGYHGKGAPVAGESNSFLYEYSPGKTVYLHFCTREELVEDFAFLDIKELYEYKKYDPRVKGPVNYIPWIVIGRYVS